MHYGDIVTDYTQVSILAAIILAIFFVIPKEYRLMVPMQNYIPTFIVGIVYPLCVYIKNQELRNAIVRELSICTSNI